MQLKTLLTIFMQLLFLFCLEATHIKGGKIHYRQLASNTFEFTFVGYRDVEGVLFGASVFDFGDGHVLDGSDGDQFPWQTPVKLNETTEVWTFKLTHTFPSSGSFVVSYSEDFRSSDILNMNESMSTSFYVEATIVNDPLLEFNSSPVFPNPDFTGVVGQPYLTTFSMIDPDGDSLSYEAIDPKQDFDLAVNGYSYPNRKEFYNGSNGIYGISSREGNLIWETENLSIIPLLESREFSIAVLVKQWRNGAVIGTNTIDYNLEIWNLTSVGNTSDLLSFSFPKSRCFSENTIRDTIRFDNVLNSTARVTFESNDSAILINEVSVWDWNEEMTENPITGDEFSIAVEFDPNLSTTNSSFSFLKMSVEFELPTEANVDSRLFISQSQTLLYLQNCDFDHLLGQEVLDNSSIKIAQNGISFLESDNLKKVVILDLFGKVLLETTLENRKTITYNFEKNTIYLLTLVSDQEVTTRKFLIK